VGFFEESCHCIVFVAFSWGRTRGRLPVPPSGIKPVEGLQGSSQRAVRCQRYRGLGLTGPELKWVGDWSKALGTYKKVGTSCSTGGHRVCCQNFAPTPEREQVTVDQRWAGREKANMHLNNRAA
jgi:hypothetical protein